MTTVSFPDQILRSVNLVRTVKVFSSDHHLMWRLVEVLMSGVDVSYRLAQSISEHAGTANEG